MNIKKIFCKILLIIVFALSFSVSTYAKNDIIDIDYFGTETCFSCIEEIKAIKSIINELENEYNIYVNLNIYDISIKKNKEILHKYDTLYEVPNNEVGISGKLFIGEKYYSKKENIENELKNLIIYYYENPNIYKKPPMKNVDKNAIEDNFNKFTVITVLVAGFVDGVNPCAIAMLLFFISFLISMERKNKSILFMGIFYSIGTFLTYFTTGIGLLKIGSFALNTKFLIIFIYFVTIMISTFLAILNLLDYINIKKGNFLKIKTQLPQNFKHKIHSFVRKSNTSKWIYFSAFITGLIVSLLEFFCTGQIYLPTITYILSTGNSFVLGILFLLIYNISFVFPILIICIVLYKGKNVIDMSQILVNKLHLIKLINMFLFATISVLIIVNLIKFF